MAELREWAGVHGGKKAEEIMQTCRATVPPYWDTLKQSTSETCNRPMPCPVHGLTRPVLLKFVAELDGPLQRIFHLADRCVIEARDTLSEEFQIAASVVDLFTERAKERMRQ